MVSKRNSPTEIGLQEWSGFFDELQSESARGAAILASVWIEDLIERKLRVHFAKGNSETRRKLFDLGGPVSAFSSKILVAHALGWIDSEIFHDINLVRKIRNCVRARGSWHRLRLSNSQSADRQVDGSRALLP